MAIPIQDTFNQLLEPYGMRINGPQSFDPQINDERFYQRVITKGSLGLGDAYVDGWWDCAELDEFFHRILKNEDDIRKRLAPVLPTIMKSFVSSLFNFQTDKYSFANAQAHYDIGNDLYKAMLDKRLVYTCGYFKDAQTLDDAQDAKLDLVCRKLGLQNGDRVLDIGCGWASFLQFAFEKYGATGTGITVSKSQIALGSERTTGMPIELRLQDYRNVIGTYDHLVSLGMIEHVGPKNFRSFFEVANRCLADDGLFLLHTIGGLVSTHSFDPWMEKYIFPHAVLPSLAQLTRAAEGLFVIEDVHNFGPDYDKTLMAWDANVTRHWPELKKTYDERFGRMWHYYLRSCAGSFRARSNQLWQIVLSKHGVSGGYKTVR